MVTAARCASSSSARRQFAVPTLERLIESRHVVARRHPARSPRGRGQQVTACAGESGRARRGVPSSNPTRLRDPTLTPRSRPGTRPRRGRGLREDSRGVLAVPRLGMINVHASLLPQYRGAAPVHRAIINGDVETGVTIMRVEKRARCRRDVRQGDTARSVPMTPAMSSSATWRGWARALLVTSSTRSRQARPRRATG